MRVLLLVLFVLTASQATAYCRQALILALDVSGSVNETEYAQQIDGLAAALQDAGVQRLILDEPGSYVVLAAFEWSSQNHQSLVADWVEIKSSADLRRFADTVGAHRRQRAGLKTAIGRALEFSQRKLAEQAQCLRHTIDISGDGKNNIGPIPKDVYARAEFNAITVNALVIDDKLNRTDETARSAMRRYYERNVIHGLGAFTEIAFGYGDYADAIRRKLERELEAPVIGWVEEHLQHPRLAATRIAP